MLFWFLQMQLPVFHIISLVVCFSLVTWKPNCDARVYGNQQDNTVFYLCGAKFKQVWERCCDHGCAPSASKRTLHGKNQDPRFFFFFFFLGGGGWGVQPKNPMFRFRFGYRFDFSILLRNYENGVFFRFVCIFIVPLVILGTRYCMRVDVNNPFYSCIVCSVTWPLSRRPLGLRGWFFSCKCGLA